MLRNCSAIMLLQSQKLPDYRKCVNTNQPQGKKQVVQKIRARHVSEENQMPNKSRDSHGAFEVVKSLNLHQPLVDMRGLGSVLTAGRPALLRNFPAKANCPNTSKYALLVTHLCVML